MSIITEYFHALSAARQKMILLAVFILIVLCLYFLIWAPLARDLDLQSQRVSVAEQDLNWLRQASTEIRALRGQNNKPLRQILPTSLKRHQLQPDSNKYDASVNEWRLRFKATDFRKLLVWLNELRRQSSVVIALANISREPAGGVNARFVLTENR